MIICILNLTQFHTKQSSCAFAEVKDHVMTMARVMTKHDSFGKLDELFDRLLYPTSSQQTAEPLLDESDLSMMATFYG